MTYRLSERAKVTPYQEGRPHREDAQGQREGRQNRSPLAPASWTAGRYKLVLSARDAAGNSSDAKRIGLRVASEPDPAPLRRRCGRLRGGPPVVQGVPQGMLRRRSHRRARSRPRPPRTDVPRGAAVQAIPPDPPFNRSGRGHRSTNGPGAAIDGVPPSVSGRAVPTAVPEDAIPAWPSAEPVVAAPAADHVIAAAAADPVVGARAGDHVGARVPRIVTPPEPPDGRGGPAGIWARRLNPGPTHVDRDGAEVRPKAQFIEAPDLERVGAGEALVRGVGEGISPSSCVRVPSSARRC